MNKRDQIVKSYFQKLGVMSHIARVKKYGEDYMAKLSQKGVEARRRNAARRALVTDLDHPEDNCKICGASHKYINDDNRSTYAKAHQKYIQSQV